MTTFKIVGDGSIKVLLLPGLMGTQSGFDAMLAFADLELFQYAVMDYRGYGDSRHHEGRFTVAEIAADAAALVDDLGWRQVAVVGHSIGALVAQLLGRARPAQVFALVSVAGMSGSAGARDPQRRQLLADAATSLAARVALVDAGSGRQYGPGFARAVARSSWQQIEAAAFAAYGRDAAATDIAPPASSSVLPVLVIVGECDPVNTAERARASTLQWYRQSSLIVLQGIGHYPMIEAPAHTLTAIERFVGTAAATAAPASDPQDAA